MAERKRFELLIRHGGQSVFKTAPSTSRTLSVCVSDKIRTYSYCSHLFYRQAQLSRVGALTFCLNQDFMIVLIKLIKTCQINQYNPINPGSHLLRLMESNQHLKLMRLLN